MKRKISKRAVALLVCLALCMTAVVGVTLAFIFAKSDPVNNTFTPANIACEAHAAFPIMGGVKNTGDAECYIRVALVVNWVKVVDGVEMIYAQQPTFTFEPLDGWFLAPDGYYYYKEKVAVSAFTNALLSVESMQVIDSISPPDGYTPSVKVVASAIQATADAVANWSNAVVVDGEIIKAK